MTEQTHVADRPPAITVPVMPLPRGLRAARRQFDDLRQRIRDDRAGDDKAVRRIVAALGRRLEAIRVVWWAFGPEMASAELDALIDDVAEGGR